MFSEIFKYFMCVLKYHLLLEFRQKQLNHARMLTSMVCILYLMFKCNFNLDSAVTIWYMEN